MTAAPFNLTGADERVVRIHAASAARRNSPTPMLMLAGVALVLASAFALWSVSSARSADLRLGAAVVSRDGVESVIAQIEGVRAAADSARTDGRYSRQLQLSTLAAINARVGLPSAPSIQEQRPRVTPDSPIAKRQVDVTMNNAPLPAALEWIHEAQRAVPGLFVSAIELRPTPAGWTVRVQVARWEFRQ